MLVYVCIAARNDPPDFSDVGLPGGVRGEPYAHTLTVADPDADDTHVITALNMPDWLGLTDNGDGTATLAGLPAENGTTTSGSRCGTHTGRPTSEPSSLVSPRIP